MNYPRCTKDFKSKSRKTNIVTWTMMNFSVQRLLHNWILICLLRYHVLTCISGADIDCLEAFSCAYALLNQTSASDDINCYGYKSCATSPGLHTTRGYIDCYGSHSCINSTTIKANGYRVNCYGFKSCANIDNIHVTSSSQHVSKIVCTGDRSCMNSQIIIDGNHTNILYCDGVLACANTIVTILQSNDWIYVHSDLGAYNATFISHSGAHFEFIGRYSTLNSTIICQASETCYIECAGHGCTGLKLACSDSNGNNSCTFDIDCYYAAKSDACPNGYDAREAIEMFENLKSVDDQVIQDIQSMYASSNNQLAQETIEIYGSILGETSIICDDYSECSSQSWNYTVYQQHIQQLRF